MAACARSSHAFAPSAAARINNLLCRNSFSAIYEDVVGLEIAKEAAGVRLHGLSSNAVFPCDCFADRKRRLPFSEHLPYPGTNGIKAIISSILEMQKHRLISDPAFDCLVRGNKLAS